MQPFVKRVYAIKVNAIKVNAIRVYAIKNMRKKSKKGADTVLVSAPTVESDQSLA